jgi:E3 ubiquitin-protein ligase synoviolin
VTPAASQAPVVFSSTGSPREPTPPQDDDEVPLRQAAAAAALRRFNAGASDKGKARAVDPDAFDAPATHRVLLTPHALPPPHTGVTRTPEAARAALDARLRALRDVDEVVWSLVGELSRLRSAWEAEDEGARSERRETTEREEPRETESTPLFSRPSEPGPSS